MKSVFCILILLFCLTNSRAQSNASLPSKGVLIEKISVADGSGKSYAAYLPKDYSASRKWAILYCFDPMARGAKAVQSFLPAAEKYGFLVVASNDSRNGAGLSELNDIFKSLWKDTHTKFNIDERRTYAAGLSGGSRLAVGFVFACPNCFAGVIGSGAGFPVSLKPTANVAFLYFGTAGVDDFNYGEMRSLEDVLTALKIPRRFAYFPGGHEWSPPEIYERALAWFNLRAMQSGALSRDEKFLDEEFNGRRAAAEKFMAEKSFLAAGRELRDALDDFAGLRDASGFAAKLQTIAASPELKKEIKNEAAQFKEQQNAANQIIALAENSGGATKKDSAWREVENRLSRLRERSEAAEDSPERRVARRALLQIFIEEYETATLRANGEKNYARAERGLELARAVYPKNYLVAYELARIYALEGKEKIALQTLAAAIESGFRDAARLQRDEAFAAFAAKAEFRRLREKIAAK